VLVSSREGNLAGIDPVPLHSLLSCANYNHSHNTETFMSKNKPIHEIRMGLVRGAIWQNETEAGVRHNVTFTRLYKDGEQWKDSTSFGRGDLLLLAKLADAAHTWLFQSAAQPQPSDDDEEAG
jgi:hypothetical protein